MDSNNLISLAKKHILELFNNTPDVRLVYHNFKKNVELSNVLEDIAESENASEEIRENSLLAAWFYFSGYLYDIETTERKSIELAKIFFKKNDFPANRIQIIENTIKNVWHQKEPQTLEEKLLNDAVHASVFCSDFFKTNPLLRLEKELITGNKFSKVEWENEMLNLLLQAKFYTSYAKLEYDPILSNNILKLKDKIEKRKEQIDKDSEKMLQQRFSRIETKIPTRAVQTFFRTNYRNHINLSSMADNKANIMISVNAILISVIISIISYRNIVEVKPMVMVPAIIFLISGLSSLVFAVLTARPKITSLNKNTDSIEKIKKNIIFFGNFVSLNIDKYEEAMDELFHDSNLIYGNMTRDIYYLGKVLDVKYKYLNISYTIFMVGFITTVISFLLILFT